MTAENAQDLPSLSGLEPATRAKLAALVVLLRKWNRAINLVAPASLDDVWGRHIADSAQLSEFLPAGARLWVDLGSGGGFPGLVVAVIAQQRAPHLRVELVEADQRKCAFLQTAARELALTVTVTRSRIEELGRRQADVVSARALASLERLCGYALPLLSSDGICLFLKGSLAEAEVAEARRSFRFEMSLIPSQTDPAGSVAKLTGLSHV